KRFSQLTRHNCCCICVCPRNELGFFSTSTWYTSRMESFVWSTGSNSAWRLSAASASSALSLLVLLLGTAYAQGPQDWIKRILDPAKIGVPPPAGAAMNRKLTVDYLS